MSRKGKCYECNHFKQSENHDNGLCKSDGGRTGFSSTCSDFEETSFEEGLKKAIIIKGDYSKNLERSSLHNSNVEHPSHYNKGKYEVIDVIEDWQLGFALGNAIKYIARAKHKGKYKEDLKKAIFYLQREVDRGE